MICDNIEPELPAEPAESELLKSAFASNVLLADALLTELSVKEQEFKLVCDKICKQGGYCRVALKMQTVFRRNDPLQFWQAIAFIIRSEQHERVDVSSFSGIDGKMRNHCSNPKLRISSACSSAEEILEKLVPRHLHNIQKHWGKILSYAYKSDAYAKAYPGELFDTVKRLISNSALDENLSNEDTRLLMSVILRKLKKFN